MKKIVLCTFVLSGASMANSECLTSFCASKEGPPVHKVTSNNLCKVNILPNGNNSSCCVPEAVCFDDSKEGSFCDGWRSSTGIESAGCSEYVAIDSCDRFY